MKKITGRVVSLVLALALVVTSFSANFAFAAKRTLSGTINDVANDTIYLANDGVRTVDLTQWLIDGETALETKDHNKADGIKVKAISHVSGDKLVNGDIKDDTANLKLRSGSADGKEVISVLYEGDYNDEDGNEFIVKGRKELTVYVYDKDTILFGKEAKDSGKGVKELDTFSWTAGSKQTVAVYKVKSNVDNKTDAKALLEDVTDKYKVEVTTGENDVELSKDQKVLTVGRRTKDGLKDANPGNVVITAKKILSDGKVSEKSADKYTLKTKIEKKVDVEALGFAGKSFTIKKDGSKSMLSDGSDKPKPVNVTDCDLVFSEKLAAESVKVDEKTRVKKISGEIKALEIGEGSVSEVKLDKGSVNVVDGKVGDIKTKDGSVTVTSGKTGNIKAEDKTATDVKVTVKGGTVGEIDCDTVEIETNDEEETITTGKITAKTLTVFSDEAKVSINGIKSKESGEITLKGDKLTVGKIDLDYRDTTVNFGDDNEAFTGKIAAPVNAENATLATNNEDTDVTVTGAVKVEEINVNTDTSIAFDSNVTVKTIDGDGSMKIFAGKLYVSEGVSSTVLKLADTTLAAGTTVYKADKDATDVDDFDCFGFTLDKTSGNDVDTFKIKSLSFAGIVINKTSSRIAKGYNETFTASAYPGSTALPTGATIKWDLEGGSTDVFKVTTTANTAKVEVLTLDSTFASENKATLTATLYDADGYEMDDYDVAKCEVTAIATPDAKSDTTKNFSVAAGASYQFKITSTTAPTFTTGTSGVFAVALTSHVGNDYFYKITATGKVGAETGIYLNGSKLLVASVKAPAFKSDTVKDFTVKGSYQFKITAPATPTFAVGTAGVFKAEFVKKVGNDYFYKITSVGAAGKDAGIYVNGTKLLVAKVG